MSHGGHSLEAPSRRDRQRAGRGGPDVRACALHNKTQQATSRTQEQPRFKSNRPCGSRLSVKRRWLDQAVSIDEPKPAAASRLALVALMASCVGWLAVPFGLLLVAWAFFVAGIIVFTNLRDGRRVPRAAYATLIISVLPLPLLHGSP